MAAQETFVPEIKQKLFIIINRLASAGGVMDTLTLAYRLASRYEVTVLYGEKEKDEVDVPLSLDETRIRFIKIHLLQRNISPVKDFLVFRTLSRLFQKYKPDIVHTHGFKPGLLGRLAAKRKGISVIIHTYHGHVLHSYYNAQISRFICFVERRLAALSTRIIAISPQQAFELSTIYRIALIQKINTIFIGISEEGFLINNGTKIQYRNEYSIPAEAIVVAIIGRLTPIKNHTFFVRVAQRILEKNQHVFFFIIGDGNQKKNIQNALQENNIIWQEGAEKKEDARIFFTGWIENIAAILPETDIVISTSLNEGTPISLIEAQWFKKPVVATNVGGMRDTIINNETGFLIDDFDIKVFEEKLQLLLNDKCLREDMGKKGESFVRKRFSKNSEADNIDALYQHCLQKRKTN